MFVFQERNSRPWVSAFSLFHCSQLLCLYLCYFDGDLFSVLCVQRKYICDLNSSGQFLHTDGIIGKVVQKSGLRTYQTKDQVKKDFFYLSVADETASVKLMVYGKEHHREIKEDNFYLFRKLIIDDKGVKVTTLSIVSETSPVEVPEELEVEARKLIYSQSPVCSIAEAKSSADGTEVSVEGIITEVSLRCHINVYT